MCVCVCVSRCAGARSDAVELPDVMTLPRLNDARPGVSRCCLTGPDVEERQMGNGIFSVGDL